MQQKQEHSLSSDFLSLELDHGSVCPPVHPLLDCVLAGLSGPHLCAVRPVSLPNPSDVTSPEWPPPLRGPPD